MAPSKPPLRRVRGERGKGSIEFKAGQWWWRRSRTQVDPDGSKRRIQIRKGPFPTREIAEAVRSQGGELTDLEVERLTWDAWLEVWLDRTLMLLRVEDRMSYGASLERAVRIHLRPRIGKVLVAETTPDDITQLWIDLLDPRDGAKKPSTVRNIRGALSLATRDALAKGKLTQDVVHLSRMPQIDHSFDDEDDSGAMEILTPEVAAWLGRVCLDGLLGRWSLPSLLALDAGTRRGETLGFRWHDLDESSGVIRARRQIIEHSGESEPRVARLKTKRSRRDIALPDRTLVALIDHRRKSGGKPSDFIFSDGGGSFLSPDAWTQAWGRQFRVKFPQLAGTSPHDLRHTHASLLLNAGEPLLAVSARLGHSKPSFTLDQYGHALPNSSRPTAQRWTSILDAAGRLAD